MPAAPGAEQAAADLAALLREVSAELDARGIADQAVAELRTPRAILGFRRTPVMAPVTRAWRLGVVLLGREGELLATGSVTRAVAPLHANNQSESQEARREIRRAAFDGPFQEGEIVNYGWRRLALDAAALESGQEPLALRDSEVLVRWAPGLGEQGLMPLRRYLADRLDLLEALALEVARADDAEAAGAQVRVTDYRQAANLIPAEPLDLVRVHPHLGRGPRAGRVVLVDRLRDRLEVLRLRAQLSVLFRLARLLVIGLATFVAPELLRLAGEVTRIRPGVAVRRVLDQLLHSKLEALGLASAALADRALLLGASLLEIVRLKFVRVLHRAPSAWLAPPTDSSAGGRAPADLSGW